MVAQLARERATRLDTAIKSQHGLVDVSPETLRFWTETVTGGAGKFVVDSSSLGVLLAAQATEEDPEKR